MREAAAGVARAHDLDRVSARFNEIDLAVFVDDKSDAIRNRPFWNVHAVGLRHFSIEKIAQNRERHAEASGKGFLGGRVVSAHAENFGAGLLEFLHARLVVLHLVGAAAGEGRRKEGYHHGAFAD